MRGASRLPTYVGRILIAVGFIMILVAWDQAARLDYLPGQFPYLLSGALPGLALIVIGAGLEYVQTARQFTAQRAKQMAELNLSVVKLIGYVKETGGLIQGPDHTADAKPVAAIDAPGPHRALPEKATRTERPVASAPAATATITEDETAVTPDAAEEIVVAGRSSFHDSECHLVSGRDDMATITRLEAEGQGLSACRVCKP